MFKIENNWDIVLKEEYNKDYLKDLYIKVLDEYKHQEIFPKYEDLFTAFKLTDFNNIKIVILGQDPYHDINQAHGLSFSVKKGIKLPPSLKNIYKEIETEYSIKMPEDYGDLSFWAQQGVLLLNTSLTVRAHMPASHKNIGWEKFTDAVIKKIDSEKENVVFILWGAHAIKKQKLITNKNHLILSSPHPSPLSSYRGFFNNNHFKLANEFLEKNKVEKINWQIKNNA